MMLPVALREVADAELEDAYDWYESQRPGLGVEFVTEVQSVFDTIAEPPTLHHTVYADIRRAVVRRFPYCVYFRVHREWIEVVAVFHGKRDPQIWRRRR